MSAVPKIAQISEGLLSIARSVERRDRYSARIAYDRIGEIPTPLPLHPVRAILSYSADSILDTLGQHRAEAFCDWVGTSLPHWTSPPLSEGERARLSEILEGVKRARVRRILASLGFDYVADAARAIRSDPDFRSRWDLSEGEALILAEWRESGSPIE
jgi:hypothetical protein